MHDFPARALALSEGFFLGAFFCGAVWWPVHRALGASPAGRWLGSTLLARATFAFAAFYGAAGGDWQRMLAVALEWGPARTLIARLTAEKTAR